jgi:hypothetical protein
MSSIQAFTIIDRRTNKPYTLTIRNRPAVMSFRKYSNAHYTANAIEERENMKLHPQEPYTLLSIKGDPESDPKHHYLRGYEEFATLLEKCKLIDSDTMFITDIETPPNKSIEFYGELFSTEMN